MSLATHERKRALTEYQDELNRALANGKSILTIDFYAYTHSCMRGHGAMDRMLARGTCSPNVLLLHCIKQMEPVMMHRRIFQAIC